MKTLFLNPNSSAAVTALLRRHLAARAPAFAWDVQGLPGAPEVIASAEDNARSEAVLAQRLPTLARGFARVVLMSSLDTGYLLARSLLPAHAVHGFTRGVLARHRVRGVHAVTFGAAMAPLYEPLFDDGRVPGRMVFDAAPAALLRDEGASLRDRLATLCERLHARQALPVFIVGALALDLAQALRGAGRPWIVDPVADLLAGLSPAR